MNALTPGELVARCDVTARREQDELLVEQHVAVTRATRAGGVLCCPLSQRADSRSREPGRERPSLLTARLRPRADRARVAHAPAVVRHCCRSPFSAVSSSARSRAPLAGHLS